MPMNPVQWISEFHLWPTSRKSVLLMSAILIAHLFMAPVVIVMASASKIADVTLITQLFLSPIAIAAFCLLLSWHAMQQGKDARWTAYPVVFLYGGWIGVMAACFGMWSTPLEAWAPVAVIMVALWYDEKVGFVAFVYCIVLTALIALLVMNDVVPYAPVLIDRDIGAQQNTLWLIMVLIPFFSLFATVFALVTFTVVARKNQANALKNSQNLIRRYAPTQIAERILVGDQAEGFKPERVKLTMFFSDIEGFTNASDHLEPEELSDLLDQYLSEMACIARKYNATINQFVGDGIMLFFGAPDVTSDKDHALRAVRMAAEMQKRILELNDTWEAHGIRTPFRARMGINTGFASVGDFGSAERKAYTAIGIQANIAARIQHDCTPGKILMTDTTWSLIKDEFNCIDRGEFDLKGVHFPVKLYELSSERNEVREPETDTKNSSKIVEFGREPVSLHSGM